MTDLSQGTDCRGDLALFVADSHVQPDGWSLDVDVGDEPTFIRIIDANGNETASNGWAQGTAIVQWG